MAETIPGVLLDILGLLSGATIACGGTNVGYSHHFPLPDQSSFSWEMQFDSPGVVNVKVELEQSTRLPSAPTVPAADLKYTVPLNKSTPMIAAVTDELVNQTSYAPNATPYARFKFTGLNSGTTNDNGTVVTRLIMSTVRNA